MPRPVLTIQHEVDCPPANVSQWAAAADVELEVLRPFDGDDLPANLRAHCALVVLGGSMGAYDSGHHPWLELTQRLIADAVLRDVPMLGICLGHQLTTVALGGVVALRTPRPAAGVVQMSATDRLADDPVFHGLPTRAPTIAFNHDVVQTLPAGAIVLGSDPDGFPHLVRYGEHAWGTQFHPEVTVPVFESWTAKVAHEGGPAGLARVTAHVRQALPSIDELWRPAMIRFFDLVTRHEATAAT